MAYRYTNTDKWNDQWFSDLKQTAKLLFMYLCDQCDIAGFLEFNEKKAAFDTGIDKQGIDKAMKDIEGRIMYSNDRKYIFIVNFLKHQRNLPINTKNSAHVSIIKKLEEYKDVFDFQHIDDFFSKGGRRGVEGGSRGGRPPYGNINNNSSNDKCSSIENLLIKESMSKDMPKKDSDESSCVCAQSDFEKFNSWISNSAPYCSNPKNFTNQITEKELDKLKEKYTSKQIADVIINIENRKDLRKRYTNLYRTVLNWAKKEYGE